MTDEFIDKTELMVVFYALKIKQLTKCYMGNLERGLALSAALMGCDDSASVGSKNFDAGCGDGGTDAICLQVDGGDATNPFDQGVSIDGRVTVDAGVRDANLNGEFTCDDNTDCHPLEYCHEINEQLSFCRENPSGPDGNVGVGMACADNNNCGPDEYCHLDNAHPDDRLDGSRCLPNPTGEIARPDAGVVGIDGGVVTPDGGTVRLDGGLVADTGTVDNDALTSDAARGDALVDGGTIVDGATDGSTDAETDAEADGGNIGPFPIPVDGAVRLDGGAVTDALTDGATDAVTPDGGVSVDGGAIVDGSTDGSTDADTDAETDGSIGPFPIPVDGAVRLDGGVVTDALGADGATDAQADGSISVDGSANQDAATDALTTDDANLSDAGATPDTANLDGDVVTDGDIDGSSDAEPDAALSDAAVTPDAALPEEPCDGACAADENCDLTDNECKPACDTNADCPVGDRCFDADVAAAEGERLGVCVEPDLKMTFDPAHGDFGINGLAVPGNVRGSWNVDAGDRSWSANLDLGEESAAFLLPPSAEAISLNCGRAVQRCLVYMVDNVRSFVPPTAQAVEVGPNENFALPGDAQPMIVTVESVAGTAERLVDRCLASPVESNCN